jgi:hypothetical protein
VFTTAPTTKHNLESAVRGTRNRIVRTNYVLIDYESVHPAAMAVLEQEHFKVIIFVGEKQAKVRFDVASALQRLGSKATYVKIAGSGPNALDFHIAFYIGQLAASEPDAYFHIISKDTGFDPLITHLKSKKIFAARSKEVTDIPLVKAANSKTPSEKLAVILANLRQRAASRPRTVKTLSSTISSLFQQSLSDGELESLLKSLQDQGIITIAGTKISYTLPG